MKATIVPVRRLTHIHVEESSRDCDGPHEHDRIFTPRHDHGFPRVWAWYVVSLASRDYDVSSTFERWTDADGLPHAEYNADTDEGYHHEHIYGCDDECDPKVYRYRDVYAERMGY
jgi:hypothetical protein